MFGFCSDHNCTQQIKSQISIKPNRNHNFHDQYLSWCSLKSWKVCMKVNFDIFICLDVSKSWTIPGSSCLWCMQASLGMQCQCHAFYARLFTLNYKKICQLHWNIQKHGSTNKHTLTIWQIAPAVVCTTYDRLESFSAHFVRKSLG